jgi:hypothetical protein
VNVVLGQLSNLDYEAIEYILDNVQVLFHLDAFKRRLKLALLLPPRRCKRKCKDQCTVVNIITDSRSTRDDVAQYQQRILMRYYPLSVVPNTGCSDMYLLLH